MCPNKDPCGNNLYILLQAPRPDGEARGPSPRRAPDPAPAVADRAVMEAAHALLAGRPAALMIGAQALSNRGLSAAARIAAASGCALLCETFPARMERGAGLPAVERVPYYPEQAVKRLSEFAALILCGASEPVAFFGTPGIPSFLTPQSCPRIILSQVHEDTESALEALAEAIRAPASGICAPLARPACPTGPLTPRSLGEAIASIQPEGVILVDEAATSGLPHFLLSAGAPPFTYLSLTGGAIGQGLPCATGAALACPDRKVLAFQADGSGMYTVQALWTQAREGLHVATIICANRIYRVLRLEMPRAGIEQPGPQALALTDLSGPTLDWVALAHGLGVPAVRVETAEVLVQQLEHALAEAGPHLIEAILV